VGELSDARSANQLVLADPASASSAWHAAALRALGDGSERLFSELPARGARIVSNEHEVLPVLLKERRALALVDGSAAFQARERGQRLGILIPDQDDRGAVLRSSVVALTHSGAARAEARDLVAYLLSAPVGRRLGLMTGRLAFLESDEASGGTMRVSDVVSLPVSQAAIADQLSAANRSPPPES
jgi:ABC-type Fe3+ transport system substrate-binding protein